MLRFLTGIFRQLEAYAINDFETLTVGVITSLPGGVATGDCRFGTATFAQR
jgi:hypothetical protein